MSSNLHRALSDALPEAMKQRDGAKVTAIRLALSAVANAEAVEAAGAGPAAGAFATDVARRSLADHEVDRIVREVHDELRRASDEMLRLGQGDRAAALADQAGALDHFLRP